MRGLWGTSTTEPAADAIPAAEPAPTAAVTAGAEEPDLSLAAQLEAIVGKEALDVLCAACDPSVCSRSCRNQLAHLGCETDADWKYVTADDLAGLGIGQLECSRLLDCDGMQLESLIRGITEGHEALLSIPRCAVCQKVFSSVECFWHCSECELWSLICEQCEKQQPDAPDTPMARQDSWPAPILQRCSREHQKCRHDNIEAMQEAQAREVFAALDIEQQGEVHPASSFTLLQESGLGHVVEQIKKVFGNDPCDESAFITKAKTMRTMQMSFDEQKKM